MPLYVKQEKILDLNHFFDLKSKSNYFKEKWKSLFNEEVKEFGARDPVIYVMQGEYAGLNPGEKGLEFIGSDEATTCQILVFRHTGSGSVVLGHFDGKNIDAGVKEMLEKVKSLSIGGPEGLLEVKLFGGFEDDRGLSAETSFEILDVLINVNASLYLVECCIGEDNDHLLNEVHFPKVTGIAVDLLTGKCFSSSFKEKGPLEAIRGAGNSHSSNMTDVYRNGRLVVGPYFWNVKSSNYKIYSLQSDQFILQNFSTSPSQESSHFVNHMKDMFKIYVDYPNPKNSLFSEGRPFYFMWSGSDKQWIKVV